MAACCEGEGTCRLQFSCRPVYFARGWARFQGGDYRRAYDDFTRVMVAAAGVDLLAERAGCIRAAAAADAGWWHLAGSDAEDCVAAFPDLYVVRGFRGWVRFRRGEYGGALRDVADAGILYGAELVRETLEE